MIYILPYKRWSDSARNLKDLLNQQMPTKYINIELPHYPLVPNSTIINWGNSSYPVRSGMKYINHPNKLAISGNKLRTFQTLHESVSIPDFTTSPNVVLEWLRNGVSVVARTILTGHSGAGIELLNDPNLPIPSAPLYVKYIKKAAEFRVHVAFGEVIDVQQKRKRTDFDQPEKFNAQIRSHHYGWVYCREGIHHSEQLNKLAIAAVARVGLDFGAVDIIYNKHYEKYYVLEINSAPGLEGETLYSYFNMFYSYLNHV